MASTSASPEARSVAPMLPAPTASHANLLRPPPIAGSSPKKSPTGFRETAAGYVPAPVAANMSPLPASADPPLLNAGGLTATSAPRKRRDAAPRSGYGMLAWPQNAASAARWSLRAARISPQWRDMLKICNALSLRFLTCAVLLGIAAPGAPARAQSNQDARMDALAQMGQDNPQAQGNPMCMRLEGQLAAIDRGAGTG